MPIVLSFKLKNVSIKKAEWHRRGSESNLLELEIEDLKITDESEEAINEVGKFGTAHTPVSSINRIRVGFNKKSSILPVGFKLEPNFTYKASVDKSPDWSYYSIYLKLLEYPVSDISKQVKQIIDTI